jgi:hypothetical protein
MCAWQGDDGAGQTIIQMAPISRNVSTSVATVGARSTFR